MALSDIISNSLFTISVTVISIALVVTLGAAILNYGDGVTATVHDLEESTQTDVAIIHSYVIDASNMSIWVKNLGELPIQNYDTSSIFIDGTLMSSSELSFHQSSDALNVGIWGVGETLQIVIEPDTPLTAGIHDVKFVTPNSYGVSEIQISL
ncbi:MAG: hypothetical protein INQ03_15770 [Candidatus Heimdallarchaeota archaeon]|nr:hypothetical protein [Candidatus Heimdallarchaeota archaeon]